MAKISLPEMLKMKGAAYVCARRAAELRAEAATLDRQFHAAMADAEAFEDAARALSETQPRNPVSPTDGG